jgi:2-amino-4-hydroxy-6-hydroxymethyldihydropteridine diphosphokinase
VALLHSNVFYIRSSRIYETEPVGVTDQPLFLNVVVAGNTNLSSRDLLRFVKSIEHRVGRRPTFRWGPRVLDIDILLYGYDTIREMDLVVPHPEMLKRDFVLIPLCELDPNVKMPDGSSPCASVSASSPNASVRMVGQLTGQAWSD